MDKVFLIIALVFMVGVFGSLFGGLFAMAKGKEKDHQTSNKMMRFRVLFQALAIVFLFLSYLARK